VHTLKEGTGVEESMDEIDKMVDKDRRIEEIINRENREKEAREAEINRLKEMLQREARKTQVAEEKSDIECQNAKARAEKIKREYEELKKLKGVERIEQ
jgi:DNA-binding transcriptional regulator of glucitol operon